MNGMDVLTKRQCPFVESPQAYEEANNKWAISYAFEFKSVADVKNVN